MAFLFFNIYSGNDFAWHTVYNIETSKKGT